MVYTSAVSFNQGENTSCSTITFSSCHINCMRKITYTFESLLEQRA